MESILKGRASQNDFNICSKRETIIFGTALVLWIQYKFYFQCKSAVVGVYEPAEEGGNFILTPAALKIATESHGRLNKILKL